MNCKAYPDSNVPSVISHNDIFSPGAAAFLGTCASQSGVNGNIAVDPGFVDPARNFHPAASSPLIDAGDNSAASLPPNDLEGYNRLVDGSGRGSAVVDIGAYEYQGTTTMTVAPVALSFPDQKVGTASAPAEVLVNNTGANPLLLGFQIGPDYSFTTDCVPHSVAPAATCKLRVSFFPTSAGAHPESLVLKSNTGSDITISLQGNGITPAVQLSPNPLVFPDQAVGSASLPQPVTLQNTGPATLNVTSIAAVGDFSQTNNCSVVPPGGSCSISAVFTPGARGARTGSLQITDDAPGSPHSAALSGKGIGPEVLFTPSPLTFGDQPVNSTSPPQNLTLTNNGELDLHISSITSTSEFSQTNNCPVGSALAPGASCMVAIQFQPLVVNQRFGYLIVNSDTVPGYRQASLMGNGVGGAVSLSPRSLTFSTPVVVGTSGAPLRMLLRNVGNAPLLISSISTTGDFSQTNNCGTSVDQGYSCSIYVTFAPLSAGSISGSLFIYQNSAVSPTTASLKGTALSSFPVPVLSSLSPGGFLLNAAGSKTLTLNGSNFFAQSTVTWNGIARDAAFVNSGQLTVNVSDADVSKSGDAVVVVHNPAPGGGDSASLRVVVYQSVPISARSMVFDSTRQVLYAGVDASAATNANWIVKIDPVTGGVTQFVFTGTGSSPDYLKLTADGQFLYAGLNPIGYGSVVRINLATGGIDETIPLGSDSYGYRYSVAALAVLPGFPRSVAVDKTSPYLRDGITIYDDLTPRATSVPPTGFFNLYSLLFFPDATQAIGNDGSSSANALYRFTVDNGGIQLRDYTNNLGGATLSTDGKRVYVTNLARVIDPANLTVVGSFNSVPNESGAQSIAGDAVTDRAFLLSYGYGTGGTRLAQIFAADAKTFSLLGYFEIPLATSSGSATNLVRFGTDGLAFRIFNPYPNPYDPPDQVIILHSSLVGPPAP